MTQTFIPTPVPEPLPLVESLVDDVLDELDEMGTSLETVNSDQLLEARYSAFDDLLHLPARRESRPSGQEGIRRLLNYPRSDVLTECRPLCSIYANSYVFVDEG